MFHWGVSKKIERIAEIAIEQNTDVLVDIRGLDNEGKETFLRWWEDDDGRRQV
jgi:hypothetical protein